MFQLALSTLKFRRASFVATFLAMFLGAAIVIACGALMETGVRMSAEPQRLGGAPIVVTGQQSGDAGAFTERRHVDPELAGVVASVPGVEGVVPDVSVQSAVLRDGKAVGGTSYGHGWGSAALTPYTLSDGTAPAARDDVVLDSDLAAASGVEPGASVRVAVRGITRTFHVTGVAGQDGGANPASALFFTDDTARLLAGGSTDSLAVVLAPGADVDAVAAAISAEVGSGAEVRTGDARGLAELPGALASQKTIVILAAVFGTAVVLIVMFGVASTFGLSLQQRVREMALLRGVGATPVQLRRMIGSETAVLSVLAVLLALLPGYWLGEALFAVLSSSGVVPSSVVYHAGWAPMAVGGLVTVLAAALATRFAGRKSARTEPVVAAAESASEAGWFSAWRLVFALFFLANGIALAVVTATLMENGPTLATTAGPASVLFCIGIALLAPGITKALVAALWLPVRLVSGLSGKLALRNAMTSSVRTAGAVAPIILLVGIATSTLYMQATEDAVSQTSYDRNVLADHLLISSSGGFAPEVLDRVRATPGVSAATDFVTSTGYLEGVGDSVELRGVSSDGVALNLDLPLVAGSLDRLTGDAVALSDKTAEKQGVKVGDRLPLQLGDGAGIRPTVVALYADNPDQNYLTLPSETLAPHTTEGVPGQILVRSSEGQADAVRDRLSTLASGVPGTELVDSSALAARNNQIQQILASANYTIVAMIASYAAITVLNTLIAVTRKRKAEFGLQQLVGATKRQVLGMLTAEGVLIGAVAILLGTIASAVTIVPYSLVKTGSWLPSGSVGIYLAIVACSLLLVFGATLTSSWRGMRSPAVEAVKEG